MASLFGSVAKKAGEGISQLGDEQREERLADMEHQRQLRLEQMRMQADRENTQLRIEADDRRQARRYEAERSLAEYDAQQRREEAEAGREATMEIEELRARTDIIQEAMRRYFSQSRTRTMRGNGFEMRNEPRQVITPNGITYEDNWSGTAPGGQPLSVVGDKVFRGGGEQQTYQFESIEQQRQAEQALIDGRVTADRFYDDFGYWPSSYIFGQVAAEDASFQSWAERNRIPLSLFGPNDRRGPSGSSESEMLRERMDDDYEYGPDAPMRPSMEEMSDGPARDAHIAAQGGRTNAEVAQELRERNAPPGSLLTQGQAAADELEQGGQLDQPVAPPATAEASGESPYGFELDDAGADEVANAVGDRLRDDIRRYGYGGVVSDGMNYRLGGTN